MHEFIEKNFHSFSSYRRLTQCNISACKRVVDNQEVLVVDLVFSTASQLQLAINGFIAKALIGQSVIMDCHLDIPQCHLIFATTSDKIDYASNLAFIK